MFLLITRGEARAVQEIKGQAEPAADRTMPETAKFREERPRPESCPKGRRGDIEVGRLVIRWTVRQAVAGKVAGHIKHDPLPGLQATDIKSAAVVLGIVVDLGLFTSAKETDSGDRLR